MTTVRGIIKSTVSDVQGQGARTLRLIDKIERVLKKAKALADTLECESTNDRFTEFARHLLAALSVNTSMSKENIKDHFDVIVKNLDVFLEVLRTIKNPRKKAEILEGLAEVLYERGFYENSLKVMTESAQSYLECSGERLKQRGRTLLLELDC
ncbi:hypothetical protein HYT84_00495 [Candidatus Micrarchaeota archaeon]|nr:hypothetical protein [Candidatus Micrarchaeota archaeon]